MSRFDGLTRAEAFEVLAAEPIPARPWPAPDRPAYAERPWFCTCGSPVAELTPGAGYYRLGRWDCATCGQPFAPYLNLCPDGTTDHA